MPKSNNSKNDQRSNSMNPNNSSYKSGTDNRSNQINPNHQKSKSSRKK